jgi:GntR family transcriptional regulator
LSPVQQPDEPHGSAGPAYKQIQTYIQELLDSADYNPGDRIPSERALAEQLGRNRMTVRKAIEGLIAMGLLERNSTSGTRIPVPRVTRPIDRPLVRRGFGGSFRLAAARRATNCCISSSPGPHPGLPSG